jgi:hypothetical protein
LKHHWFFGGFPAQRRSNVGPLKPGIEVKSQYLSSKLKIFGHVMHHVFIATAFRVDWQDSPQVLRPQLTPVKIGCKCHQSVGLRRKSPPMIDPLDEGPIPALHLTDRRH